MFFFASFVVLALLIVVINSDASHKFPYPQNETVSDSSMAALFDEVKPGEILTVPDFR